MLFRFLNITVIYSKYCNNLRQYSVGGNMQNMGIRRKITIITDYINNPSFASSFPPAALFVQDKKFAFESIWKALINIVTIVFNVITRMFYILRPHYWCFVKSSISEYFALEWKWFRAWDFDSVRKYSMKFKSCTHNSFIHVEKNVNINLDCVLLDSWDKVCLINDNICTWYHILSFTKYKFNTCTIASLVQCNLTIYYSMYGIDIWSPAVYIYIYS